MAVTDIGTLITSTPGVCGGRPRIAGTRMTVRAIVYLAREGLGPDQIAGEYPHITVAQVHAALAYYYANREELDGQFEAEEVEEIELERSWRKERGLPPIQPPS